MTWYALIQTTDEDVHLYELVDATTDEEIAARGERIQALRAQHGIPEQWEGIDWPPPIHYDVALLEGPLHPTLLARATMHPLEPTP